MRKILMMASVMMLGMSGAWALGTTAGTVIENNATLSYSAGGVQQPDVNATITGSNSSADSFVVDKKIDMILETDDSDQIEVTPGQTNRVTHYTFKNEGNSDQNFTFSSSNLANGEEADYDNDADNENVSNRVIRCTGGTPNPATSAADGTVTVEVAEDATLTCTLSVTIPSAPTGADGDVMNVELLATAVDASGNDEQETSGSDTPGSVDIVFADGETIHNGSAAGNLGDTAAEDNSTKGDTAGDGKDAARSGYIIVTPVLSVTKTSCVVSDPVNNTTNPKRIPGAIIRYMFDIDNTGTGDVDDLNITDTISNDLLTTGTKASAKKDENQASCACGTAPGTDINGDTTVTGQNLLIEKVDVAHGSTTGSPGHNHTCVSVEVEIK